MTPLRLAIVTREYPPLTPYTGGIGRQVAALAPGLVREGFVVDVLTFHPRRREVRVVDGVTVRLARRPARELPSIGWESCWPALASAHVLRHGPYDLVLAGEWGGDVAPLALLQSRHRPKVVTNLHTSVEQALAISPEERRPPVHVRLRRAVQAGAERRQTESSDAILACSRAIADWAAELWDLEGVPLEVLPNMVDVARVRRLADGPLPKGFPRGRRTVVFAGRIEHRKGVLVLLEAMETVWAAEDGEDPVHLVLLGRDTSWEGGSMTRRLLELSGARRPLVHALGEQPPERLYPGMAAADVLVAPSLWEAFGIVALEALSVGRPLIATDTGGLGELLAGGEDAVVVAPDDAQELARALRAVLRDPGRARALAANAARRSWDFDSDAVVPRYAAALRRVAGRSPAPG